MRFVFALCLLPFAAAAAEPVTLHWLGDAAPAAPNGITWGVPWPKGALHQTDPLTLTTADGKSIPVQTWPIAFWPDGSVKWTGHAITATANLAAPLRLGPGATVTPSTPITIRDDAKFVDVDTGVMHVRLTKDPFNPNVVESIAIGDRVVAESGRLHVSLEDRTGLEGPKFDSTEGRVERVTVEQSGPVRAVVKVEGHLAAKHLVGEGGPWLPFVLRLQFFAGSGAIRLTHSLVYDGSPPVDLIKGLGLSFQVPFREELHNRHLRLAGDADGGMWNQPVRLLPGYRPQVGRGVGDLYARHLAGERVPNLADFDARTREAILTVPVWEEAKLTQDSPNGWTLQKRTSFVYPWLHVTDGRRAQGFALMGDVSGALAIGVKDFWQKAPKALELREAHSPAGSFSVWLWSRDVPAMTLGRYDEDPHGLAVNYEDWKPGWGTALGIANTHDLTLWACDRIPSNEQLVAMAREAAAPPLLVCTPEYYHAQQAGGRWSLPDRATPATRWIEDQVETFVNYYRDQVDERSWYGFWDFGDIMHNYDFGRHEWRYDIGGWAWANTELMPDLLLWDSFLRTGRADLFRLAEAMTRHTSEVDVHHVGPFAPLGSRHNVNHWGDGAKQPRVSHAGLKRTYYFLTGGDGRIGDLLREQIDADLTYSYLQRFNNAHYVPDANGGEPHLQSATSVTAPRPEDFAARPTAASRQPFTRFGLEWMCYAANWTTEWERGGDQTWRARLETDMKTMAANLDALGRFPGRYFDMIFGGPENLWEMEPMYDLPEFWRAWANTCESVGRQVEGGQMTGPRMLAYAAFKKNDAALGRLAWEKLIGPPGKLPPLNRPKKFSGPGVLRPVTDPDFLGASVGWQLHGVASVQWALNAIETLEFAKPWLPLWENPPAPPR